MSAQISNFSSVCSTLIEKAHAQTTQNNSATSEALAAALLLAIYLANDLTIGKYLSA